MKKIIKKNVVEREKGYLYYITSEGHLGRAKLSVGGKAKLRANKRKKEEMYF